MLARGQALSHGVGGFGTKQPDLTPTHSVGKQVEAPGLGPGEGGWPGAAGCTRTLGDFLKHLEQVVFKHLVLLHLSCQLLLPAEQTVEQGMETPALPAHRLWVTWLGIYPLIRWLLCGTADQPEAGEGARGSEGRVCLVPQGPSQGTDPPPAGGVTLTGGLYLTVLGSPSS